MTDTGYKIQDAGHGTAVWGSRSATLLCSALRSRAWWCYDASTALPTASAAAASRSCRTFAESASAIRGSE